MTNYTCVHCGCVLTMDEVRLFRDEEYCEECLEELTTTCDHCGRQIFQEDAEGDSNTTLCSRCYSDHYVTCEHCGRLLRNEDALYDDEDNPYCSSCYQEINRICSYNYKPDPVFYGEGKRYFGVELEVDKGGEIHANARKVTDLAAGRVYCKHDGSLDDGFEVVTHPMTLDYHCNQMPWQSIVTLLKEMGYRSHQTTTSGLHIVGGPIEAIYPYEDAVALVCHEEGKLLGLPLNRAVRDPSTGTVIDIISGTFFICGLGEDDFASLSCEQIAYYSKIFQNPEIFLQSGTQLIIFQIEQ